jgi:toxin ParE1/3/4
MKIIWRKRASDDLQVIYDYIKLDSPQNAVMVFKKIHDLVNSLDIFPERYPVDKTINDSNVRFAVLWNYKIVYSIEKNAIVVLRIFSTRQHPNKLNP